LFQKSLLAIPLIATFLAACTASVPLSDSELLGQRLFLQTCAACHATTPGTMIVGPTLAGISISAETRVDGLSAREYIEQSILDPSAYVNPGFEDVMPKTLSSVYNDEELRALIDYLFTLSE
jgi:mono/diheme cytochrome c family protein